MKAQLAVATLVVAVLSAGVWVEMAVWSECLDAHSFLYCLRTIK